MARPGKSDKEREYEKLIQLAERYLNLEGETNKVKLERKKIFEQMVALDKSLSKVEFKNVESVKEILSTYQSILEVQKEIREEKEEEYKLEEQKQKAIQKQQESYKKFKSDYSNFYNKYLNNDRRNFSDTLRNLGNARYGSALNTINQIRSDVTDNVVKEYTAQGKTDPKYFGEMTKAIEEGVDSKLKEQGINKSAKDLQIAASLLNSAGELLMSGITSITKLFGEGINKQVSIYEQTFSGIAARSGMTKSKYFNAQLNTMSDLYNRNLMDNIGISDIQTMWDKLAKVGMSDTDILINGIENVITEKIVPYLDTSSLAVTLLNDRVNGQFVKDIRGINKANLELVGNNYATEKILNQMIDLVQPLSDEAVKNLALGSTEVTTMINTLMKPKSQGGLGMTLDAATEAAVMAFKTQEYSAQMLSSGSSFEKYYMSQLMEHPELNAYNPADWNNMAGLALNSASVLMGGQNYDSTANGLLANIVRGSQGVSYQLAQGVTSNKDVDWVKLSNSFDTTQDKIEALGEDVVEELSSGTYNTATEMQEYLTQNIATPIATISEQVGRFGRDILSTLKTLVTAYIGGKIADGIANAIGLGSGTVGLSSLLGSASPIGLALGGVGLTLGGIFNYLKSKDNEHTDSVKNYGSRVQSLYNSSVANLKESGVAESEINKNKLFAEALNKAQSQDNAGIWKSGGEVYLEKDKNGNIISGNKLGILTAFTNMPKEDRISFGLTPETAVIGAEEAKKALDKYASEGNWEQYNTIKTVALAAALNSNKNLIKTSDVYAALSIEMLMDKLNKDTAIINPIKKYLGFDLMNDKQTIQKYLDDVGITKASQLMNVYKDLGSKTYDYYLASSGGNFHAYPTEEELKRDYNLHRQGLAKVPYDEYPAILHAGETIMTASTTATMESMVQAFRESQNQNYRIDVAIQEQTAQLIAKLDEVIGTISTLSFSNTNTNSPSEKLRTSLRTLNNSLAFLG